jgi:purine-binding chemotaxis protein CheW
MNAPPATHHPPLTTQPSLASPTGQEAAVDGLLVATFLLGNAAFGIGAAQVQEVVRLGDITPVHQAPPYVVGIRNLRGKIVTVIDLRVRLDMGSVDAGANSRILIVDWQGEPVGLLVDSIADTISLNPADIVPPPPNLHGVQSRNLGGVYRSGERLVALLDHGAVLQLEERANQPSTSERTTHEPKSLSR